MPPEDEDLNVTDGADVYGAATEVVEQDPTAPELPAGSETSSDPSDAAEVETDPAEQVQVPAKQPAQPRLALTDKDIAEIVARTTQIATPRQAPQQPALSQEQITALLKPVRVTAEQLKHFGIENASPEQLAGIQQFLEQPAQNAIAVAKLMMEHQHQQFLRESQHIVEFYNQQQAETHRNTFYKSNEDLKGFEDIVSLVANKVSETNQDGSPKSNSQIMKEVASSARAVLAKTGVQLKPAQPATHGAGQQRSSNVPTMPSLQRPGRSLGAQPSGGANNPDADIYS